MKNLVKSVRVFHNNNTALMKQIYLLYIDLVMTKTFSFNSRLKKYLLTNKEVKTDIWPILPPPPDTIKAHFTPILLGLKLSLQKTDQCSTRGTDEYKGFSYTNSPCQKSEGNSISFINPIPGRGGGNVLSHHIMKAYFAICIS